MYWTLIRAQTSACSIQKAHVLALDLETTKGGLVILTMVAINYIKILIPKKVQSIEMMQYLNRRMTKLHMTRHR